MRSAQILTRGLAFVGIGAVLNPAGAALTAHAQEPLPLASDRPDFTEGTATIAPGRFQVEAGYTFTRTDGLEQHAAGEVLVRIGLLERLEGRLEVGSFVAADAAAAGSDGVFEGFEDPSVGFKLGLVRAAAVDVSVLAGTTLPIGSEEIGAPEAQPSAILSLSRELADGLSLGANVGITSVIEAGRRFAEGSGSVALGIPLGERLGAFVEYFGLYPERAAGPDRHFLDAGLTWPLAPDFQLDARLGIGLNDPAADFFAGAGLAWRR